MSNVAIAWLPIVVVGFIEIIPTLAAADCYAGSTPDWGDVRTVEIVRCQQTNMAYPCYEALLTGAGQSGIDAALVAYRFHGQSGWYFAPESAGSDWSQVIDLIRQADFINLQIPDTRPPKGSIAVVHVDGPEDQIIVRRCNVSVAINAGVSYDTQSEQYNRFIGLVNKLDAIVSALPWQKTKDGATMRDVERYLLP